MKNDKIIVNIFGVENRRRLKRMVVRCPMGPKGRRSFTEKGVQHVLEDIAKQIEAAAPESDFGLVELGPREFNFVWRRYKPSGVPL